MPNHFRQPSPEDYDPDDEVRPDSLRGRAAAGLQAGGGALLSLGLLAFLALVSVAQLRSCVVTVPKREETGPVPRHPNWEDASERYLVERLAHAWKASGRSVDSASVWIVPDSSINAASIGNGAFVLWTSLRSLPDDAVDAIFAHEIAHDQLAHSRKAGEVADVADFVGEALSTFSGADRETSATLKRWSGNFILPRYSRGQEMAADSAAVALLAQWGYNEPASSLCRTFALLRTRVGEAGGGFFSSHPALSERVQRIGEIYRTEPHIQACR